MTRKLIVLVAAGLALAACDSLGVRTVGGPTPVYKTNDLDYAAGGRELRVVVLDNGGLLGGSHAALQQATIAGLQSSIGSKARLSAAPQNFNREFKVVVLFNPAPDVSGGSLCRESESPKSGGAGGGETHVLAVFCRTTDVLTEMDGYASGIQAAGDGRFNALMIAMGRGLFPSRDINPGGINRN